MADESHNDSSPRLIRNIQMSHLTIRCIAAESAIALVALSNGPLIRKQVEDGNAPRAVVAMFNKLERIKHGIGILANDQRNGEVGNWAKRKVDNGVAQHIFRHGPSEEDDYPGFFPGVDSIKWMAFTTRKTRDVSSAWRRERNRRVPFLLFELMLQPPIVPASEQRLPTTVPLGDGRSTQVGFLECPTGSPHYCYLGDDDDRPKKVSGCLFIADRIAKMAHAGEDYNVEDQAEMVAFRRLGEYNPTVTLNHTDYYKLRDKLLAIGIINVGRNGSIDKAEMQLGRWQKAHWNFLRHGILNRDQVDQAIAELGYLPGIIIKGHYWRFVASTCKHYRSFWSHATYKTVLWTSCEFGNTWTDLGVCSVIAGLRELFAWVRDVYWPWFRRYLLDLDLDLYY